MKLDPIGLRQSQSRRLDLLMVFAIEVAHADAARLSRALQLQKRTPLPDALRTTVRRVDQVRGESSCR
jgi:hypothetical protein